MLVELLLGAAVLIAFLVAVETWLDWETRPRRRESLSPRMLYLVSTYTRRSR